MNIGLQLYSVKDYMEKDVESTIQQVAEMGYTMVEPAGFFDKSAEDFKSICDKNGLKICSTHTSFTNLTGDNYKTWLPYHNTLECPYYIAPWGKYSNAADLDNFINTIDVCDKLCKEYGIEFMYHNHHKEFLPNDDGIIPHLEMQKRTNIRFQIDVYWVYRAGLNPIYVLEQLGDRVGAIHLKDGTMEHGAPLGQGDVDIPAIVKWAKARNLLMVVENEPTAERQMIEAKECIEYLKSIDA
jgi:sugar phosphate isomerase/epimerase